MNTIQSFRHKIRRSVRAASDAVPAQSMIDLSIGTHRALKGVQGKSQEEQVEVLSGVRDSLINYEAPEEELAALVEASQQSLQEQVDNLTEKIEFLQEQLSAAQAKLEAGVSAESLAGEVQSMLEEAVAFATEATTIAAERDFAAHQESKNSYVDDDEFDEDEG